MVRRLVISALLLGLSLTCTAAPAGPTIVDRKATANGAMTGWLEEIPWPDQSDTSQAWRKLAVTLVIARHGKVVRRFQSGQTFWNWNFWASGRQVVWEEGPVHGTPRFARADVKTGKLLERWEGDEESEAAPAWVKAADPRQ